MDSTIAGGFGLDQPVPLPLANTNLQQVELPQFIHRHKDDVTPNSFLLADIQLAIQESADRIRGFQGDPDFYKDVLQSIDPLRGVLRTSNLKYTPEYYDIRILDCQLKIVIPKSRVLLFTPRSRYYFVEYQCSIVVALLRSNLSVTETDVKLESREDELNTPDDLFYSKIDSADDLIIPFYDDADESYEDRWKTSQEDIGGLVDLIVHTDESWNRTVSKVWLREDRRLYYDRYFWEPALHGLRLLNAGGAVVFKVSALGFRSIADLTYILKYTFAKVTISKPASSSPISQEHYIVAQGFMPDRYAAISPKINVLLTRLDEFSKANANLPFYSLVKNLNDTFPTVNEAANFIRWFEEMVNQIAIYVDANTKLFEFALADRKTGFIENGATVIVDHTSVRFGLNYAGHNVLKLNLPTHQTAFPSQHSTATQSFPLSKAYIPKLHTFYLCQTIHNLIQRILDLPDLQDILTMPGVQKGQRMMTMADYYNSRTAIGYQMREWFGIMWANGELQAMINDANQITTILNNKIMTAPLIFGVGSSKPTSTLHDLKASGFLQRMIPLFQAFVIETINLQQDPTSQTKFRFKVTALTNRRFRIGYAHNNVDYNLSKTIDGALGEYEIFNLLRDDELDEEITSSTLTELLNDDMFRLRLFEHAGLSIFFMGFSNELSVAELYFNYKPDVECFASATNRHAPQWYSANPSDRRLGASGNFFDLTKFNPDVSLAMAFPPIDYFLFQRTTNALIKIFREVLQTSNPNLAIVLVFPDTNDNNDYFSTTMIDNDIAAIHLSTKLIDSLYNTYTGHPVKIKFKVVCLKTTGHSFHI